MTAVRANASGRAVAGVRLVCCAFLAACLVASCGPSASPPTARWDLFSQNLVGHWKEAAIERSGGLTREADGFSLKAGSPMTGIVFPSWADDGLPLMDYAIQYEAMRVTGSDFFGSVTFPVGEATRCITFVLGGWGGSQVGISCIDGYDASENSTGSSQRFENGRWYRVRIELRKKSLRVRLDDRAIIETNLHGRSLSLRAGDIANCVPFGFASYGTEGRVRNVVVERLPAAE